MLADYPPIADHALIGDLQTAALVCVDGSIDWFCCPRFDSPSVFARILDRQRGGSFQIAAAHPHCVVRQLYFPESAVVITRFMAEEGVAELVDFMPIAPLKVATDRRRIVRLLRGVRGEIPFVLSCAPRFDYARGEHALEILPFGAVFATENLTLTLHGAEGLEPESDGSVSLTRLVHANESIASFSKVRQTRLRVASILRSPATCSRIRFGSGEVGLVV